MKKAGLLNVFSLIFNLLIIGGVVYTSIVLFQGLVLEKIHLFSVLSSFVLAFTALICIPFNFVGIAKKRRLPSGIYALKLIGTTTSLMALVMTVSVLGYVNGWDIAGLFGNFDINSPSLFLLLIIPVVAMIGFIFFDHTEKGKFPINFLSMLPMLAYSGAYIANGFLKFYADSMGSYEWYGVGAIHQLAVPAAFGGLVIVALLVSILIYLLNRGLSKAFFKAVESQREVEDRPIEGVTFVQESEEAPQSSRPIERSEPVQAQEEVSDESDKGGSLASDKEEPAHEEQPVEVDEPEEEVVEEPEEEPEEEIEESEETPKKPKSTKKTTKKPAAPKKGAPKGSPKETGNSSSSSTGGTKVYHLTKRKEDGMWAITFVGGKKPVKLFKTKKEAEEYLNVLINNQGATALIRNSKGAKAGKFASSIKSDKDEDKK